MGRKKKKSLVSVELCKELSGVEGSLLFSDSDKYNVFIRQLLSRLNDANDKKYTSGNNKLSMFSEYTTAQLLDYTPVGTDLLKLEENGTFTALPGYVINFKEDVGYNMVNMFNQIYQYGGVGSKGYFIGSGLNHDFIYAINKGLPPINDITSMYRIQFVVLVRNDYLLTCNIFPAGGEHSVKELLEEVMAFKVDARFLVREYAKLGAEEQVNCNLANLTEEFANRYIRGNVTGVSLSFSSYLKEMSLNGWALLFGAGSLYS